MTRPPCWDEINNVDCPRRVVGCRKVCEKWAEWLVIHDEELNRARKNKQKDIDILKFFGEQHSSDLADVRRKMAQMRGR